MDEKRKEEEEAERRRKEEMKREMKERREVVIEFLDTAGEYEGFRHLRPWHYKDVDVFLLAFDITNRESFVNVTRYWTEEIKTWTPASVKILIGTKVDIADAGSGGAEGGEANKKGGKGKKGRQVSKDDAEQLAKRIDAVTYVEISSVTQINLTCLLELCVAQVFEEDDGAAGGPNDPKQ